jgi:hypothetical protein
MSKREMIKKWAAISGPDQAYLRAAYDRYKKRLVPRTSPNTAIVSFELWLSKRGIQKRTQIE